MKTAKKLYREWKKRIHRKTKDEKKEKKGFLLKFLDRIKKHDLEPFLKRAGIYADPGKVAKTVFLVSVLLNLLVSAFFIFFSIIKGYSVSFIFAVLGFTWTVIFLFILLVSWFLLHISLDVLMWKRKVALEEVLPDYFQLVASNLRSGMPIDKALWLAVRPRFGVLASEIEVVAKKTMSGKSLTNALRDFARKYDSTVLTRSINLLIIGIDSGGEIGSLLDKITTNIRDQQLLKKEISASVASYTIFIAVAALIGAPLLFGLSDQLLRVMHSLGSTIEVPQVMSGFGAGFGMSISPSDFRIFAITNLVITASFSASIIAMIKKGTIKAGALTIPLFVIIAVGLFFLFAQLLSGFFAVLF